MLSCWQQNYLHPRKNPLYYDHHMWETSSEGERSIKNDSQVKQMAVRASDVTQTGKGGPKRAQARKEGSWKVIMYVSLAEGAPIPLDL